MTAKGWRKRQIMQWVPSEKKEQTDQEPDDLTIAYMTGFHAGKNKDAPQREWVGLTDEQIEAIAKNYALGNPTTPLHFARAIEAKLREKNT